MEIFPIQHLTYKIWALRLCNLIFAYCNVRSWHIQNCLTTLPLRSGCFPQQPTAKSHPLSFAWEIHPWFYLLFLPPPCITRALSWSQSLKPLPLPWKWGTLKPVPGGRWQHLICWPVDVESQQFLLWLNWDYWAAASHAAGPCRGAMCSSATAS